MLMCCGVSTFSEIKRIYHHMTWHRYEKLNWLLRTWFGIAPVDSGIPWRGIPWRGICSEYFQKAPADLRHVSSRLWVCGPQLQQESHFLNLL